MRISVKYDPKTKKLTTVEHKVDYEKLKEEYYNNQDYYITSTKKLDRLKDLKDYIRIDISIHKPLKSLGCIKKIYGNLSIQHDEFCDFGELTYVKNDLTFYGVSIKTLGKIERVGGNLNCRYSLIESLGNLKRVSGRISLRDTNIVDLGVLEYVGGDLFLPKHMENYDLSNIVVKGNVKYWKRSGTSNIHQINNKYNWINIPFFSTIHKEELKLKTRKLTGEMLVQRCYKPSELNSYILENIEDFFSFVDQRLSELYGAKFSFYNSLYNEVKSLNKINQELPSIDLKRGHKDFLNKAQKRANEIIRTNNNKYPFVKYNSVLKLFKKQYDFKGYTSKYHLRYNEHKLGYGEYTGDIYVNGGKMKNKSFIFYVENILLQTFSVLVYHYQNEFRVSRNIPKIGEGWVSETDLYYKLKEHFKTEKVIHHGKPKWLGRQHIDIWFPKHNIGIEYQGLQHDKAIDFFGGKASFVKNQERDLRKKELFVKNNAHLIEVRKGYDVQSLINQINSIIGVGFKAS